MLQVRFVIGESFYHAGPEEAEEQMQEGILVLSCLAHHVLDGSNSCLEQTMLYTAVTTGVQGEISGMDTEMTEIQGKMSSLKKVCMQHNLFSICLHMFCHFAIKMLKSRVTGALWQIWRFY